MNSVYIVPRSIQYGYRVDPLFLMKTKGLSDMYFRSMQFRSDTLKKQHKTLLEIRENTHNTRHFHVLSKKL